jgi:antitoxin (DNA-binding transcriptional repressor) of toxin-antitoxin stability system
MIERGEEVILARNGRPVAQLIPVKKSGSILGAGVGDPNYPYNTPDEQFFDPISDEEVDALVDGQL